MIPPAQPIREHYCYVLFRETGVPFYVGYGKGERWLHHEKRSHKRQTHKDRVICRVIERLGDLPKIKVAEHLSIQEARNIEISLISIIGRESNSGPLINQTDGGDGVSGLRVSDATRQKLRESHLGQPGFWTGKHRSVETRQKLRNAQLGRVMPDKTREKLREIATNNNPFKGRKHSNETRAKLRVASLGRPSAFAGRRHSEETRARLRLASLGNKINTGRWQSEETKAKLRAAKVGRRWFKRPDGSTYMAYRAADHWDRPGRGASL